MLRRHDDPSCNIAVAAAAQATISMRYLMRPRRIDTIDIITPTVMRVGRNSVVGRVASGQNRPKERASGSSQLNRNAPNPPHRRAVNADRNHQLNYELPNAASIVPDQTAQTQFP